MKNRNIYIALWILIIILCLIGLWPIGVAVAMVLIYKMKKDEESNRAAKEAEVEFYKTAAELEHKINTER